MQKNKLYIVSILTEVQIMTEFLKSSLQNASFKIIFQLMFRCITFGLNAFVLRHVSPSVVGVINVRLLLLESTVLFLSREAFRKACPSKASEPNWIQVVNLIWLSVPLCMIFSAIFGYIWLNCLLLPSEDITKHYDLGVWAVCVSCVIEMCSEPVYLISQAFLFIKFKVVMDTIYITVRSVTYAFLIVYQPHKAVVAFSSAQILAAFVYTLGYYTYFHYYCIVERNKSIDKKEDPRFGTRTPVTEADKEFPFNSVYNFFPSRTRSEPFVNHNLTKLTWSFFKQGILKQVLTEGEKYIMTLFSVLSFSEQGIYDIINNLGSLAARFLFQPVEESAYFYFSQMVVRDKALNNQDEKCIKETADVLHKALRCLTCVGLIILVFGQSYSSLLLFLYGGKGLIMGHGPKLMQTHCLSVLLLAVNGITECYAFATMNTEQIDRHNYIMALLSVLFLLVSWVLTRLLGGVGFIFANCCNMFIRIVHSIRFIRYRYQGTKYNPLLGLIPGSYFIASLILAGTITQISQVFLFEQLKILHLCIGLLCFLLVILSWAYEERELVLLALQKWRQKQD